MLNRRMDLNSKYDLLLETKNKEKLNEQKLKIDVAWSKKQIIHKI